MIFTAGIRGIEDQAVEDVFCEHGVLLCRPDGSPAQGDQQRKSVKFSHIRSNDSSGHEGLKNKQNNKGQCGNQGLGENLT